MKIIDAKTKLIALLGMPLGQSFSPMVQNEIYAKLNLNYFYLPVEVAETKNLQPILEGIRRMNFAGFAVTKPYKEAIMEYLDEVDPLAEKMGSCNTVVVKDGRFIGYNTDGVGCMRSLEEEGKVNFKNSVFFSFGAGGTGKSVCFELAQRGAKRIYISSRSDMCEKLAENINSFYPNSCIPIRVRPCNEKKIEEYLANSDVLLNLAGTGMYPKLDETPVDASLIKPSHVCFDATYNPAKTRFLLEAEAKGCKIINGLGMMVHQGTRQMNIWFGMEEPTAEMFESLTRITSQK